jgi:5-formyltetrahydrofolate cyclo-ligase
MVVPSLPELSKDALRVAALESRKAYVRTLDDAQRTLLEQKLAQQLTSVCAAATVVAGYAPIGSEISPLLAMEEARAVGAIVAFPAFSDPAKPFCFRAGDPCDCGPFGILQPKRQAPQVVPDLVLVPLLAIDGAGTRIGRGRGHYDRVLARLRTDGTKLIGVGWAIQRLPTTIPADPWDVRMDAFASPDGLELF